MELIQLINAIQPLKITWAGKHLESALDSSTGIDVTELHYDHRGVKPGGVFVAIKGFSTDGHHYIQAAIDQGAVAVVTQKPISAPVPIIEVANTRKALALLSARFYGEPSGHLTLIGITGTNGKTTTAYLIENMLLAAGLPVGVIGTVNYRYGGHTFDNPVTTPESLDLQRILSKMHAAGISTVVLEVSSHALDLHRIQGCQFNVGVFTNLTQDHLDYHGDMNHYWACKKKLFSEYLANHQNAVAVINADNSHGQELLEDLDYHCISTGRSIKSSIYPKKVTIDFDGIRGQIATPLGHLHFNSFLVGEHNLENILSAVGVGSALGLPLETIGKGIDNTQSVPGRLERVHINGGNRGPRIYVDYAHTPDALENVLRALRRLAPERILTIFGCGGDRDRDKRPQMGHIAASFSDLTIVTSDNPRSEDPDDIINQILPGVQNVRPIEYDCHNLTGSFSQKGYCREPDRKQAIWSGIRHARTEDIVLIAGKGHETYQIIGDTTISFDDRLVAKEALISTQKGVD